MKAFGSGFVFIGLWAALFFLLLPAFSAQAQSTIRGGISVEQGYDSNIDRVPENETSEWTTSVTPSMEYTRLERRSSFSARYAPGVVYNWRTNEERLDHFASGEYWRQLTRNLRVTLGDTFVRTEDPYEDEEAVEDGIEVSDQRGRRRYWTNDATVSAEYTYGRDSSAEAGYSYRVLDNSDDEEYSDYVRHRPFISILHNINNQWDAGLDAAYVKGDFDENTDDFSEHSEDFYLYYRATRFTRLFSHLGFLARNYDITPEDYEVYTAAAGVEQRYSPSLDIGMEAGASRVNRENFEDSDALYLRASFEKTWQRSAWTAEAESGLDARDFTGEDDMGLSRYWRVGTGITRTLTRNITGSLDLSYRDDEYLEREPEVDEQRAEARAGLSWSFGRWYELSGRYIFVDNNADIEADNYTDHRFYISLSAEKDLLQW